ncbi:hypothetical protein [Dysgonomonas sp. BGC7]|uniref:hypothetical protein n=1 Tax=Dysgonomonas sp. BGC7 TaxID=1658008 RepID=UPI00068004F3|nr:hypothetical protein [Dysgonomonas sp. BGC7]MBD8388617.1 hypothetical protein [Dysgonomonas sp. BGC7]
MKKVIMSMVMCVALMASTAVMAQDAKPKKGECCKEKTECTKEKKDSATKEKDTSKDKKACTKDNTKSCCKKDKK